MVHKINEIVGAVNELVLEVEELERSVEQLADEKTPKIAGAKGPELLPCPFCGCPAYVSPLVSGGYMARCTACHTSQRQETNRQAAVERWNRRTEDWA